MELTCKKCTFFTLLAVLLQLTGLILFVLGFFPVKPALKGVSGIESLKPGCHEIEDIMHSSLQISQYQEESEIRRQYDRFIIMVIDGLPAEFLLGKGSLPPSQEMLAAMPFTQGLLSSRRAIGYHAKAAPPTVTMPRLKAMTSGAIAGFLDVAFNFNTQALLDDNLVGQLARAGWNMVMYGDETWLRLFPNAFIRHDGVSSFYVKDTVQVDENVTRHLTAELAASDWDLLILHYLGLDHVGHLGGRASSLMAPKLKEMDMVIQQVHTCLIGNSTPTGRRTLLMVASDHGMTYGGNHGGATFEETDALALFIAEKRFQNFLGAHNDQALQVDLVPTLALLLGVPIPINSVGILIPNLFSSLTVREKLRALELNSWQIMRLLKVRSPKSSCLRSLCSKQETLDDSKDENDEKDVIKFCSLFRVAEDLHQRWKDQLCSKENPSCNLVDWQVVARKYMEFLKAASGWLARGTTEKNMLSIYTGGLLMLISLAMLLGISLWIWKTVSQFSKGAPEVWTSKLEELIALGGVCIHAFSFNSSSLVEEEQFTWHYLVVTLCFTFIRSTCQLSSCQPAPGWRLTPHWTRSPRASCAIHDSNPNGESQERRGHYAYAKRKIKIQFLAIVVVLITGRVLRGWHRSGVNWAHLPDVAKWFDQTDPLILLAVRLMSLVSVTVMSCSLVLEWTPRNLMQRITAANLGLAALLILFYAVLTNDIIARPSDQWPTLSARLVYAILGSTALVALLVTPWVITCSIPRPKAMVESKKIRRRDYPANTDDGVFSSFVAREQACLNFIGKVFVSCWCLLQLLLQQSVNTMPVGFLLLQLISILVFFNDAGSMHSSWLKVLTLYWMGASGHFGLGNTNTLATVDVAGAYIGLSRHSIFLSGLLAFMITYASPLLYMMGLLLMASFVGSSRTYPQENDTIQMQQLQHWLLEAIALPCVVPLLLSSVILVVFTGVMLLMQDHLFVWSVFSPKYLYVCFTVLCTYLGVLINTTTGLYTSLVIQKRLTS